MSYNTRRGNYNGRQNNTPGRQNNTPGRPNQNTNFVSGGQYKPNDRPVIQMPAQQQPQQPTTPQQKANFQQTTPVFQTTNTSHVPQPATTPLKSIMKQPIKQETATPASTPAPTPTPAPSTPAPTPMEHQPSDTKTDDNGVAGEKPKKFWTGGHKLSKRERRILRNKRVGRHIRPKNASMVLNELTGGEQLKFEELGVQNTLFGISVQVDGQTYEAYAPSKNGAKQKACENALKGYIAKVVRGKQQTRENAAANGQESGDNSMQVDEEEDISWCQLASFALYKLMDSWQDVSEMQPEAIFQKTAPKPGATPRPSKELPANAAEIHPVMLLHQVRPGTIFEDVSSMGQAPNITYTVKVNIEGEDTFGQGPNKKTARKNCAFAVMEKHYNIQYPLAVKDSSESVPATA